jgi:UDP-N-acetylmuramate dehydrogenase
MKLRENFSLKEVSTFHVRAMTQYYSEFASVAELKEILASEFVKGQPFMILGGGSNLLFTKDYEGLVIRNLDKGITVVKEEEDCVYIKANSGEKWHHFVIHCVNNNYGGIENLSLIPGTVGAGPIQNIGAYGVELKDVLTEVEAMNIKTQEVKTFTNAECKFGYRESVFKSELKGKYVILSVTLRLQKNPAKVNASYGSISKELTDAGITNPTIKDVSDTVIKIRSSKLPDPEKIGNAGSFFKNPVLLNEQFEKLKAKHPNIVSFTAHEGHTKLAAGWLIEECGWKGKRFGDAGVHKDQALVLVNYDNATGTEIFNLSTKIIASVKEKFGVELEREVNMI